MRIVSVKILVIYLLFFLMKKSYFDIFKIYLYLLNVMFVNDE